MSRIAIWLASLLAMWGCGKPDGLEAYLTRQSASMGIDTASLFGECRRHGATVTLNREAGCASVYFASGSYHACWEGDRKISEVLKSGPDQVFSKAWDSTGASRDVASPRNLP